MINQPQFPPVLSRLVDRFEERILSKRAYSYPSVPQPRYAPYREEDGPFFHNGYWGTFRDIGQLGLDNQPEYHVNSRKLDSWLTNIWRACPWLSGMIAQLIMMEKNRQYSIVGPLSTVQRIVEIFRTADQGQGFRAHREYLAQSFYTTNMGAVPQWLREGQTAVYDDGSFDPAPLKGIAYYDPTECVLTGKWRTPLQYYGRSGFAGQKKGQLGLGTHSRFASMQHVQEGFRGLGYCLVMRIIPLLRLAIAALGAYLEALDSRSPNGFILLSGIDQQAYMDAVQQYGARMDEQGRLYFTGSMVITNETGKVDGKFLPFATIPQGFTLKEFFEWVMTGYANAAGHPVDTFIPINTGRGFGRQGEVEASNRRAENRGRNEFSLSHQEVLQANLPQRAHFEYERHDAGERLTEAEVSLAWLTVAQKMNEVGVGPEDTLSLLVDQEVLPPRVTQAVEDSISTDTGKFLQAERAVLRRTRERVLANLDIRTKIEDVAREKEEEPIVRYRWTVHNEWPMGFTEILWTGARQALQRESHPVAIPPVEA